MPGSRSLILKGFSIERKEQFSTSKTEHIYLIFILIIVFTYLLIIWRGQGEGRVNLFEHGKCVKNFFHNFDRPFHPTLATRHLFWCLY